MNDLDPFASCVWEARQALWEAPDEPSAQYRPQDYQRAFHEQMSWRIKAVSGGIGAAKTMTVVHDYMHEGIVAPQRMIMGFQGADGCNGRIAITGRNYDQPRIAFNYLYQKWHAAGLIKGQVSRPREGQWFMQTKTGVEVLTISADKPETFAARPYTVVHLCEAAQQPREMLDAALERTSRWPTLPGRVYLEGTFEELAMQPWFPELCRLWQFPNEMNARFFKFRSWNNHFTFPGGLQNDKIQGALTYYRGIGREDLFHVRYGGEVPVNPGELWGAVFDPDLHVRADAEFDAALPVDIAVDPGTHRYAILFLQWPHERRCNIVDELVLSNADYDQVRTELLKLPYAERIDYGVIDIAGTQRHQSNESTHARWAAPRDDTHKGMGLTLDYQYLTKEDGINVLKAGLRGEFYDLRIHPRCTELLGDIKQEKLDQHGELNERLNKGHDDCRKALSYYLRCKKGFVPIRRPRRSGGQAITSVPGRVIATALGNVRTM